MGPILESINKNSKCDLWRDKKCKANDTSNRRFVANRIIISIAMRVIGSGSRYGIRRDQVTYFIPLQSSSMIALIAQLASLAIILFSSVLIPLSSTYC